MNGVTVNLRSGAGALLATTVTATNAGNTGYYLFTNLVPGDYKVEFVKPAGYAFALRDFGTDAGDSDADTISGMTVTTTLVSGENDLSWDAGLILLTPGIDIEKTTNGPTNSNPVAADYDNEDTANGAGVAILTAGSTVNWTYKVTNTGNTNFAAGDIAIVDDNGTIGNTADDLSMANGQITFQSVAVGDADNILEAGEVWLYGASGIVQNLSSGLGASTTIDFSGSSALDGSDGNIRTFTNGAVSVKTSAFSRDKGTGAWSAAFLGSYGGGLGVTDSGEGDGSGDGHTVDNMGGRDNYVLFEFNQSVVVDSTFLGYVVGDSDIKVWIGTRTDPFNNHATLSDSVLSGLGFTEINLTSLTAARLADLNAGNLAGNVLVVAANTTEASPEDRFKIEQVTVRQPGSGGVYVNKATITAPGTVGDSDLSHYKNPTPPAVAAIGNFVWEDKNANGVQDAGEAGIANVTVKLLNSGGTVVGTTTTGANGEYLFGNLNPADYKVQVVAPSGYFVTGKDLGGNDATDSDIDATGTTVLTTLSPGETDLTWDAGLFRKASIGDRVWLDCDADGVQDAGEVGVANVTVNLLNSAGAVVATQQTNSSGNYLFTGLTPGAYSVQFAALPGYAFTTKDAGADGSDSDADTVTGKTGQYVLQSGETNLTVDAGLTPVCRPVTFDFSGNSATDGTDGNSRTYSDVLTGVSVTARAFSQDKGTNTWQAAYLGAYGGGLGVTDSSEGSGGSDMHTVDNVGRNNYVVLQFSQAVKVDKAFLGYVVGDSDVQVWIGSAASAITSMNNSVLASMGFTEVNYAADANTRWADLNAGGATGNVLIIAADTTDATPEDRFKLEQIAICAPDCCAPVAKASIGNFVWEDKNYNGLQDSGEAGIANVTVKLLNSVGAVLASTTTGANGEYLFGNLNPADYKVQVVAPSGYFTTKKDQGANDGVDSDIDSTGTTVLTTLSAGENDLSWDAGFYRKASVGDKVWEDKNHNNIQDAGEPGVGNIKVALLSSTGAVLANTTTNASGNYLFANLDPGVYAVQFDKAGVMYNSFNMNSWKWANKDVGGNDALDSDVTGNGIATTNLTKTDNFTLVSGQSDLTRDAGITPIVIDLDGNGIQTISRADATAGFDLFGNGAAVKSGWISAGDAFLAVDKNGNGRIDGIGELFGGTAKGAGFASLAGYDSNGDGLASDADTAFGQLMVWRDANGNHATDAGELVTLTQAGIASLAVGYIELPFLDRQGNLHLERSAATLSDGSSVDMTDVYFNVSVEDAAAAGVTLPSLADLLGDQQSLEALLGSDGQTTVSSGLGGADEAQAGTDAGEVLRRIAAMSRDESSYTAAA